VALAVGERLGSGAASTALLLLLSGGVGLVIYVAVSWVLGVEEVRAVRDLLWHRVPAPVVKG
jgi:hypothetical protein